MSLMFLHFHKLTTELFHSIKTQQISLFNASVGPSANCLCHLLRAIAMVCKVPVLSSRGLCLCRRSVVPLTETNPVEGGDIVPERGAVKNF